MSVILKADIKRKLKEIGLESGDNVIVHTSLKSMGYVCGGAQAVIEALIETVGENGTIMMPTQSWKNLDPETGVHGEVDEKDWPLIRENWPAYVEEHILCHKGAYTGKSGITRDRTGKLWYYRNSKR